MSKPFRDASSGVGLDVVVTLPADVCEKIKQEAKERNETVSGWCRAELIAAVEVARLRGPARRARLRRAAGAPEGAGDEEARRPRDANPR